MFWFSSLKASGEEETKKNWKIENLTCLLLAMAIGHIIIMLFEKQTYFPHTISIDALDISNILGDTPADSQAPESLFIDESQFLYLTLSS